MKQKQISNILDVSQPYLSMILNGQRNITYKMAKKLKNITNIKIEFWMEANPDELKQALLQLTQKESA